MLNHLIGSIRTHAEKDSESFRYEVMYVIGEDPQHGILLECKLIDMPGYWSVKMSYDTVMKDSIAP